jgi:hypothetical protein
MPILFIIYVSWLQSFFRDVEDQQAVILMMEEDKQLLEHEPPPSVSPTLGTA